MCMHNVHTNRYIHEHVCTWYIQLCKCMYVYIHVHKCINMYMRVCTMCRHVCIGWQYPVQGGRIPDVHNISF